MTLTPHPEQAPLAALTPWTCLVCGELGAADVVLNVLLFLPLGAALYRAGAGARGAVAAGAGLSLAIELLQAAVLAGRDGTLSDVVTNTAGAAAGAVIAMAWPRLVRPGPALARRLASLGVLVWGGLLAGSDLALRPTAPGGPLRVSWAPERPGRATFGGTVIGARASGSPLVPGSPPPAALLRDVAGGVATITLSVRPGPPTTSAAPVLDVTDEAERALIGFARSGDALAFTVWTGAARARFRGATVQLDGAFHGLPQDSVVSFAAEVTRRRVRLERLRPAPLHVERRLAAEQGWRLLLPARGGLPDALASIAWLGVPAILILYWASIAVSRARASPGRTGPDSSPIPRGRV